MCQAAFTHVVGWNLGERVLSFNSSFGYINKIILYVLFPDADQDKLDGRELHTDTWIKSNYYHMDVFLCLNGEVISLLGRCNNISDCGDASDEHNCTDTSGKLN